MNPQEQFCPNVGCHASGEKGGGNIVIHSRKQRRYKCRGSGDGQGTEKAGIPGDEECRKWDVFAAKALLL